MSQRAVENTENSLEKIKRQLASASGRNLLQGPLLKRSETVINLSSFFWLINHFVDQYSILCYFCLITKIAPFHIINLRVSIFIVLLELWLPCNSNVLWVLWSLKHRHLVSDMCQHKIPTHVITLNYVIFTNYYQLWCVSVPVMLHSLWSFEYPILFWCS